MVSDNCKILKVFKSHVFEFNSSVLTTPTHVSNICLLYLSNNRYWIMILVIQRKLRIVIIILCISVLIYGNENSNFFFQNLLNHVYERHFEYSLPVSIIFARNSEMKEKLNVKQRERLKVLLLSYSRSGSSLLGELLSLHPSTSYYFEPFWKYDRPERFVKWATEAIPQIIAEGVRDGLD